ncbi:Odorant-binding protein 56g-6 [Drosophila willistoni]|uniref:Odorant-binding protein 56g-6 n=1 Tax=Drosophila willistoni TaxID=7260 RepID=B4MRU4_DROWI|nr:uncharacterized protein LOC6641026 [Drosophila willistoni]EDW74833.1 Odorant-binding protein 56g-6 [Drosophila willistoni]
MRSELALVMLFSCLIQLLVAQDALENEQTPIPCLSDSEEEIAYVEPGQSAKLRDINDAMKCGIHMILQIKKIIDEDGNLLVENIKDKFIGSGKEESIQKGLSACVGIEGANPCDKAFNIIHCLASYSKAFVPLTTPFFR